MKYIIVVDSVAAIPDFFYKQRPIKVLPITLNIDGEIKPDDIDEQSLIDIYQSDTLKVKSKIITASPEPEQIARFILDEVVPYADYAICQTMSRQTGSALYKNFETVASRIAKESHNVRSRLGIDHPFRMTYMSTGTGIAGQGLVAIYADTLLNKGTEIQDYTRIMNKFTKVVRTYAIVKDIYYTRQRGLEKGIDSVGLAPALLGKAVGLTPVVEIYDDKTTPVTAKLGFEKALESLIEYTIERIQEGLYTPVVNISYAGDLNDITKLPVIDRLRETAQKHKVKLLFGVMRLGASSMYGPGGFSIGLAPKNGKDKPR